MREKLIQDMENKKKIGSVSPMKRETFVQDNLLPVQTSENTVSNLEENWDNEPEVSTYQPPVRPRYLSQRVTGPQEEVRVASAELSQNSAKKEKKNNKKIKKRNPNYQFTVDDYFSPNLSSRSPSPVAIHHQPQPRETHQPERRIDREVENKNSITSNPYKVKTGGVKYQNVEEIRTNPLLDPPPRSCFNCWGQGHCAINCPQSKKNKYCTNCGRLDRVVSTCERCKKAYLSSMSTSCQNEARRQVENPRDETWDLTYRFPLPVGAQSQNPSNQVRSIQCQPGNIQSRLGNRNGQSQSSYGQSQSSYVPTQSSKIHNQSRYDQSQSRSGQQSRQSRGGIQSRLGNRSVQQNVVVEDEEIQERESQALQLLRELQEVDEETRKAILRAVYLKKK